MCGCNVCHYMIDISMYYLWYGNYVPYYGTVRAWWKSSKVLGIVTMVYQCSTIQALYTD